MGNKEAMMPIHPTRILSRIEPGRWNEYLSKYLKIDVSLYE